MATDARSGVVGCINKLVSQAGTRCSVFRSAQQTATTPATPTNLPLAPCLRFHRSLRGDDTLESIVPFPGFHKILEKFFDRKVEMSNSLYPTHFTELEQTLNAFVPSETGLGLNAGTYYKERVWRPCLGLAGIISRHSQGSHEYLSSPMVYDRDVACDTGSIQSRSAESGLQTTVVMQFSNPEIWTDCVEECIESIVSRGEYSWFNTLPDHSRSVPIQHGATPPPRIPLIPIPDVFEKVFKSHGLGDTLDDLLLSSRLPRINSVVRPNDPLSSRREFKVAQIILQNAWSYAVDMDATFIIISNGNYERIGIRHREFRTLFLSETFRIAGQGYSLLKSHAGLYMAADNELYERNTKMEKDLEDARRINAIPMLISFSQATAEQIISLIDRMMFMHERDLVQVCGFKQFGSRGLNLLVETASDSLSDSDSDSPSSSSGSVLPNHIASVHGLADWDPREIIQCRNDELPVLKITPSSSPRCSAQEAKLYLNDVQIMSNLAVILSHDTKTSLALYNYYCNYMKLYKTEAIHDIIHPHYSLFYQDTGTNPGMALILQHPGSAIKAKTKLTPAQSNGFRDHLTQFHNAGYLHGSIKRNNLRIATNGGRVFTIGFSKTRPVNVDPRVAQQECQAEMDTLKSILAHHRWTNTYKTPTELVNSRSAMDPGPSSGRKASQGGIQPQKRGHAEMEPQDASEGGPRKIWRGENDIEIANIGGSLSAQCHQQNQQDDTSWLPSTSALDLLVLLGWLDPSVTPDNDRLDGGVRPAPVSGLDSNDSDIGFPVCLDERIGMIFGPRTEL
ncbi:hypothetical protein BDN72DRAFT_962183 [Pluteus cervinus]|uniref:Uncharacterized protein n=1 Tax=Pluteus cervinus TaxID=181527 RepID=A0ACD3AJH9_9AGAR|nr:hypothetical protein BDN72DRAFT_962183 [Pluteus cervinus]